MSRSQLIVSTETPADPHEEMTLIDWKGGRDLSSAVSFVAGGSSWRKMRCFHGGDLLNVVNTIR